MENWFTRRRRILGRIVQGKQLPKFTYRFDTRAPGIVRASGFQPWDASGTLLIQDHVNGSVQAGPNAGAAAKHISQWVSTGGYGMVKKIDATFAQQVLNTYLYKIDTAAAAQTGNFYDVNDLFDRLGKNRPFRTQREWVKVGGVPENSIVAYMTGKEYAVQLGGPKNDEAPDEAALASWHVF